MAKTKKTSKKKTPPCQGGICNPRRSQGLKAGKPKKGKYTLVRLKGPGTFICAHVSKQGGRTNLTFVDLEIDGRNVVNISYAAVKNLGMTESNPYGLVLTESKALKNLSIGYPVPLVFKKELVLRVHVNETGIVQLLANVIHGQ